MSNPADLIDADVAHLVSTPESACPTTPVAYFPYECSCGERYESIEDAWYCRKCRDYTSKGYCTSVVDVRTGEVVQGSVEPGTYPEKTYTQTPWVQPTLADVWS